MFQKNLNYQQKTELLRFIAKHLEDTADPTKTLLDYRENIKDLYLELQQGKVNLDTVAECCATLTIDIVILCAVLKEGKFAEKYNDHFTYQLLNYQEFIKSQKDGTSKHESPLENKFVLGHGKTK